MVTQYWTALTYHREAHALVRCNNKTEIHEIWLALKISEGVFNETYGVEIMNRVCLGLNQWFKTMKDEETRLIEGFGFWARLSEFD